MKLHQVLVLGAMAMALSACADDKDNKDKPNKPETPSTTEIKYDGAVPEDLSAKVKEANTVEKVDLLAAVKAGEAAKVKIGEKEFNLVGGKWSTAAIQPDAFNVQGYATTKEDVAKLQSKKATYKGIAIGADAKDKGALKYDIDFATNKGKGEITGIAQVAGVEKISKIVLDEVTLDVNKGAGKVTLEVTREGEKSAEQPKTEDKPTPIDMKPEPRGDAPELTYNVNVYGPQANEIAGAIDHKKAPQLVFHGSRATDTVPAKTDK